MVLHYWRLSLLWYISSALMVWDKRDVGTSVGWYEVTLLCRNSGRVYERHEPSLTSRNRRSILSGKSTSICSGGEFTKWCVEFWNLRLSSPVALNLRTFLLVSGNCFLDSPNCIFDLAQHSLFYFFNTFFVIISHIGGAA